MQSSHFNLKPLEGVFLDGDNGDCGNGRRAEPDEVECANKMCDFNFIIPEVLNDPTDTFDLNSTVSRSIL